MLKYYGIVKPVSLRVKGAIKTNQIRYGGNGPGCSKEVLEKSKKTCLEKYGVPYSFQSDNNKTKTKETLVEKYGSVENRYKVSQDKRKKTCLEKYGVENPFESFEITHKNVIEKYGSFEEYYKQRLAKQSLVIQDKYGVKYACMRQEARNMSSNKSSPNEEFAKELEENKISYQREFSIEKYSYDFKVGNILIEINPFATHNSTWGVFNNPKDRMYHFNKSKLARENGYRCICIWDWDNHDKFIRLLKSRETIYARNCSIKEVPKKDTDSYLNIYHLQNTCKGQSIRLGLYYKDTLVSIMTFGKPRYNNNYEYELLRYCSSYNVIGGEERLFKYFKDNYSPKSIISYCDLAKFNGNIYTKLGFIPKHTNNPSLHWYKDGIHITNNLLTQCGFDKLFNTQYGKGSSNRELMLAHGFVEIYDCGQEIFIYKEKY